MHGKLVKWHEKGIGNELLYLYKITPEYNQPSAANSNFPPCILNSVTEGKHA